MPVFSFALISIACLNVAPVSALFATIIIGCSNSFLISFNRLFCSGIVYPQVSVGSIMNIIIVARCFSASMACFSIGFLFSSGLSNSPGVSMYWFPSASYPKLSFVVVNG